MKNGIIEEWNTGIMEFWNDGVLGLNAKYPIFQYSIIPGSLFRS
jgi:hypothetical protein